MIDTVAKSLVINEAGKILLLVRSSTDAHAPERYDFPGGGVEADEDPAAAARRECLEEAGINLENSQLQLIYAGTSSKHDKLVNRLLYLAHVVDTTVTLSVEHSAYKWVSLDDAIQLFDHPFYGTGIRLVREHGLASK